MDVYSIAYNHDFNGLIAAYVEDMQLEVECSVFSPDAIESITHAVVFDDGEEFLDILAILQANQVKIRVIASPITRVVNIKKDTQFEGLKSTDHYEYIGRGSYWGNPYSMYEDGEDRDEVIRKYKYDFDYEKFPRKDKALVYRLAGKQLGCFCSPQSCHGDVLADFLNAWDDGK